MNHGLKIAHKVPTRLILIFGIIVYQMRNRLKKFKKLATEKNRIKNTSVDLKKRVRLTRSAIFKKVGQDEQKNETSTTNINYIQNFMSIFLN